MNRNEQDVTINDQEFTVSELKVGDMLPILPRLTGTPEEQQESQMEIIKLSVSLDGELLGDRVNELGVSAYMKLVSIVLQVNGLAEAEDEGKD